LIQISRILKGNGKPKNSHTVTGRPFGPRPCELGLAWPGQGFGPWQGAGVCTSGALTARSLSLRAVWWRSRLGLGSAVDKVWWRRRHEHRGGKGSMPNKVVAVGAHPRIMSKVRGGVTKPLARCCSKAVGELRWSATRATESCSMRG
jgi:hypothetical protein